MKFKETVKKLHVCDIYTRSVRNDRHMTHSLNVTLNFLNPILRIFAQMITICTKRNIFS